MDTSSIRTPLEAYQKKQAHQSEDKAFASVALIIRSQPIEQNDVLFIERSSNPSDPWSGHIALPGGKLSRSDQSNLVTAIRETYEEVGLILNTAEYVCQLPQVFSANYPRQSISPFVFLITHNAQSMTIDPKEVAQYFWVPLPFLQAQQKSAQQSKIFNLPNNKKKVWGVTGRILHSCLNILKP